MKSQKSTSSSSHLNHDESIVDLLKRKKTTLSAEVIPPRNGAESERILEQISTLKDAKVDFISVTKGAGGSLRGGTLPIAQIIRSEFQIKSVAHFTCRDFSIEEVENSLMDHYYFGIRNILALRGDPPDGKTDHFKEVPSRHSYAYKLVEQITALNEGKYIIRDGFDKSAEPFRKGQPTNFCIGVAAYPEDPFPNAIQYFEKKVRAGAHYAITQMIFDASCYGTFLEACEKSKCSVPILPGMRIITSAAAGQRMRDKFGVSVPDSLLTSLSQAKTKEDGIKIGLEFSISLGEKLLKAGAPGLHLFIMSDEKTGSHFLKHFHSVTIKA